MSINFNSLTTTAASSVTTSVTVAATAAAATSNSATKTTPNNLKPFSLIKLPEDILCDIIFSYGDRNTQINLMLQCRKFSLIIKNSPDNLARIGKIFAQHYAPFIYPSVNFLSFTPASGILAFSKEQNEKSSTEIVHTANDKSVRHKIPFQFDSVYFDPKSNVYIAIKEGIRNWDHNANGFRITKGAQLIVWDGTTNTIKQQIELADSHPTVHGQYIVQQKSKREIAISHFNSPGKEETIKGNFNEIEFIGFSHDFKRIFTRTIYPGVIANNDAKAAENENAGTNEVAVTRIVIEIRDVASKEKAIIATIEPEKAVYTNVTKVKFRSHTDGTPYQAFYDSSKDLFYVPVDLYKKVKNSDRYRTMDWATQVYDSHTGTHIKTVATGRNEVVEFSSLFDLKNRVVYEMMAEPRVISMDTLKQTGEIQIPYNLQDRNWILDEDTRIMLIYNQTAIMFFDLFNNKFIKGLRTQHEIVKLDWDKKNKVIYIWDKSKTLFAYDYSLKQEQQTTNEKDTKEKESGTSWSRSVLGKPASASDPAIPPAAMWICSANSMEKMLQSAQEMLKKEEALAKQIAQCKEALLAKYQGLKNSSIASAAQSSAAAAPQDPLIEVYEQLNKIIDAIPKGSNRDSLIMHMLHFIKVNFDDNKRAWLLFTRFSSEDFREHDVVQKIWREISKFKLVN